MKDDSLSINNLASNSCYVTEMSLKTLSQKLLTNFCQKAQNFVCFVSYNFVQISPICDPNIYQIMCAKMFDFQCQDQQW